jgi:hypothetical protein
VGQQVIASTPQTSTCRAAFRPVFPGLLCEKFSRQGLRAAFDAESDGNQSMQRALFGPIHEQIEKATQP